MIKDLTELQKLLKLCRKQGVDEITLEGVVIKFGAMPRKDADDPEEVDDVTAPAGLTPEQMIFYSAGIGGQPP